MRKDTVVLQQASGEHQSLLALTLARHTNYCLRHDLDYWPIFGNGLQPGVHAFMEKTVWIERALKAGYEGVVWIDADAMIARQDISVRDGIPERGIGAVWHTYKWPEGFYDHFNCGVLYIRNSIEVQTFVARWCGGDAGGHAWADQHIFNTLVEEKPDIITRLGYEWHSCIPQIGETPLVSEEKPVVLAWHGIGPPKARLYGMQQYMVTENW